MPKCCGRKTIRGIAYKGEIMEKLIVQKNTVDEFPIAYTLDGNLNSKNLIVMLHGGGMDHHEKGAYPE